MCKLTQTDLFCDHLNEDSIPSKLTVKSATLLYV